jgi:membrane protein
MKHFFRCIFKAIEDTVNKDGVEHAGYMSFMVLFSFFPFLVFFLAITSLVGASDIGQDFLSLLLSNLPDNTTSVMKSRIKEIMDIPPSSLLTLAIFGSIWTASSFVEGLRTILNKIYHITSPPPYLLRRLMSILQFFCITMITLLIMLLYIAVPIILAKFPTLYVVIAQYELYIIYPKIILLFLFLLINLSLIYYIVPNTKLRFTQILPGSLLTTILWMISGKFLSEYIIYYNQLSVVYGSLGGIIVSLLFFFVISMLFIYGAAFNYLYQRKKS